MFILESEMAEDYTVVILHDPFYHYIRRTGSLVVRYVDDGENPVGLQVAAAFERVLSQSEDRATVNRLVHKNYAEVFLHKFMNVTSKESPLSRKEQKAVMRGLLNKPGIAESLRKAPFQYIDGGKYGKMTIWLMSHGAVNAAFALKRFW